MGSSSRVGACLQLKHELMAVFCVKTLVWEMDSKGKYLQIYTAAKVAHRPGGSHAACALRGAATDSSLAQTCAQTAWAAARLWGAWAHLKAQYFL